MIRGAYKLADLHESFRESCQLALEYMDQDDLEPIVTETYRSPKDQEAAFRRGVSKARAWQSAHQYGLAIDVTTTFGYNSAQQKRIHEIFGLMGFFTIAWDLPHGEHPAFRQLLAQARRR